MFDPSLADGADNSLDLLPADSFASLAGAGADAAVAVAVGDVAVESVGGKVVAGAGDFGDSQKVSSRRR